MKQILVTLALCLCALSASAQRSDSPWTLNTTAYSTNYWTSLIYNVASNAIIKLTSSGRDSMIAESVVPDADLVFPIGMGLKDDAFPTGIRCPYNRAFANPFKHIGDYAIGVDASYHPAWLGVYAGLAFKSQEVVFKYTGDNMRGYYVKPRAGIQLGSRNKRTYVEAGAFYDFTVGYSGIDPYTRKALSDGWGLDFAIGSRSSKRGVEYLIRFSMPLHNFFNQDFTLADGTKPLADAERKVGYLMLTARKTL